MKVNNDLHYKSTQELISALANKEISSVELLEETISRIEMLDKKINAIPIRDFESARKVAKAADSAIARGERLPLLGLPMTVKESFNVAGFATTWGSPDYKDWRPNEDALSVTRLKQAGAIIIGKSNVPHMLADWQTYNDIYGVTNNPWNTDLTPGGSSGGAAAALAAGFVSLELGSDFAGSLRAPAHYCGVCTHKPSQDLIPMRGGLPPNLPTSFNRVDLLVTGPMARTAADLALAFDILAGPDEMLDGKGYKLSLLPSKHKQLKEFRVLVIDSHPLCPTANSIKQAIDNLVDNLIRVGVNVSHDTKNLPSLAEITRNFANFFGAAAAARMPNKAYEELQGAATELAADDMSLSACTLRGIVSTHRDIILANRMRDALQQQWCNLFNEFDVIICPAMSTPAFPHNHSDRQKRQIDIDGAQVPYGDQITWPSIATLFGLPSTVMPIATTENNLPVGIQIIGDYLEDNTTLEFAKLLERELGGFFRPSP